jgi:arsenate reductase (thioredoxin)
MTWRWGTLLVLVAALLGCGGATRDGAAGERGSAEREAAVLFVCEHGNVKSLMAASYFDRIARERGLHAHAVSRGAAPDSDSVPPAIAEALRGDGFDVSAFRPAKVSARDVAGAARVVTFGVELQADAGGAVAVPRERWDDVPPASLDYARSRDALLVHVRALAAELAAQR